MEKYSSDELENKISEIGGKIIERLNQRPSLLSALTRNHLTDSLISLSLKNNALRSSLFRFIDVLPSLKSDQEVIAVFLEYLSEKLDQFPASFRQGLKWAEKGTVLNPIAARSIRSMVESLASRFILGKNFKEAIPAIYRLQKSDRSVSVDLLGETTLSSSEGIACQNHYLELLEKLHEFPSERKGAQISVKLSSLNHRLNPADWDNTIRTSVELLRPIFEKAKALGVAVILDMESHYLKDLIIKTFTTLLEEESFREKPHAGIAIQNYLARSPEDLNGLVKWAESRNRPIMIRMVKGAYWDYEIAQALQKNWPIPVFLNKGETDLQIEKGVEFLLGHSPLIRTIIGSHNIRTLSSAIAINELSGFTKDHLEIQMLYGMADPLQIALVELGHSVRIYAPTGEILPGMAYLIRRLMENSANQSILATTVTGISVTPDALNSPSASDPVNHRFPFTFQPLFKNEPPLDFSDQKKREAIESELKQVISGLVKEIPNVPLVIHGEKVNSQRTLKSVNPAMPSQVLGKVSQAGINEGHSAVQAALMAFQDWKKSVVGERVELLRRVARHFQKIRSHLIALEILEVGKNWIEADGDVCESIDFLNYYANEMIRLGGHYSRRDLVSSYPGENNQLLLQPLGVVAAIPPWNFPLALSTGMIASGLVAGNCVIYKPSSLSPILGSRLVDIFLAEGVPPGVLQFLPGEGKVIGEFLIRHPEIPLITFTGSNEVGRHILEVTSNIQKGQKHFKRVIAEMGGKNAIIIDESADLDEAIQGVTGSAFGFQGQKCSACSRVIVHQGIYPEFVRRLKEVARDLIRGDPQSPSTDIGPVIDQNAKLKIESYIATGQKEADTVYIREGKEPGHFIGPAIFENVPLDSPLSQEEIFGPVLALFKAETFDHALTIANDSLFALTGGVYSRKPSHLEKAKDAFHAGNLYLNRKITGAMVGRHPFGGFNLSGMGMKTGGPDYLLQFMQVKSISENSSRRGYIPE